MIDNLLNLIKLNEKISVRDWLKLAYGWQRLWIVTTILSSIYFCLWFPFAEAAKHDAWRYTINRAINAEMLKPECLRYMNELLEMLEEPALDFSGAVGCYNIYEFRKNLKNRSSINPKIYQEDFEIESWKNIFEYATIGIAFLVTISTFLYVFGMIVSWVRTGFLKVNKNE